MKTVRLFVLHVHVGVETAERKINDLLNEGYEIISYEMQMGANGYSVLFVYFEEEEIKSGKGETK